MQLALRVIAILSFIVAIVWMIVTPGPEPVLAFLAGIATLITSFAIDKSKGETETLDQRNRRVMLNHVENFWVKGVLEKSLHGAALLELGIKEDPTAVSYPWTMKRESTGETLPEGKTMLEIFNEIGMGRSLLILGAPGSGKTTMLLELARQLIERARQDETEPIPVVFNLASWKEKQTLADLLAEQLNTLYYVPKKIAPTWVDENRMLLFLDGLDEVKQASREKCVENINEFRNEHGLTSLVICSRSQDYAELKVQLAFDGAIEIQPLTQKHVTDYFSRYENRLAGVKHFLKQDSTLHEMINTPLFLSIITLAYKDKQSNEILDFKNADKQREYLFDSYISRMFERLERPKNLRFEKRDFLHWISWLASKMIEHNQIPFLLEHIQPNWLSRTSQKILYAIILGLIGGLVGAIDGLLGGAIYAGVICDFNYGLSYGLSYGWLFGMMGGLLLGIVIGLIKIETVERLDWSWKRAGDGLMHSIGTSLLVGSAMGIIGWFSLKPGYDLASRLNFVLGVTLLCCLGILLIYMLAYGLRSQKIDKTTAAGQRIKLSFTNALSIFLIFGLLFGIFLGSGMMVIIGKLFETTYNWREILLYGMVSGQAMGIAIGLLYGGAAILQHYVLRLILNRNNYLPWQLVPFLEEATNLIFLRRVGGGYIFIHRTLMEHFAKMELQAEDG